MNKQELIEKLLTKPKGEVSRADVERILSGAIEEIKNAVIVGDTVQLVGFGSFSARDRAAREARNPQTGEVLHIAAKKSPVFKAGKAFKDALN